MNAKLTLAKQTITLSRYKALFITLLAVSSGLIGCEQQPKSMFEQYAEVDSANDLTRASYDEIAVPATIMVNSGRLDDKGTVTIQINKQQAIARQPNCDGKACQYFELNVLEFVPAQPWLTSIMWQNIAQVLAPGRPLASQDQTAKDTVLMLFNQIEYNEQVTTTLPIYERIDSELIVHPIATVNNDLASEDAFEPIATGYLVVRSTTQRDSSRQYLDYVMLDMQKKLQLTLEDILLADVSTDQLLAAFNSAKEYWLRAHGVEDASLAKWSLELSKQWYLDQQGLHLVYQSGQLIDKDTDVIDLVVPYSQLQGLIKPSYIVKSTAS